jgi:uncharacterized repeat protein (TIGR03803 family)
MRSRKPCCGAKAIFAVFTTLVLALAIVPTPAQAQTFTVLYSFTGGTDGGNPYAGLVRDAAGNLYGTAAIGGSSQFSGGTVFKVDTRGNETVLYSFCSVSGCFDGGFPVATLVLDASGNLYGTTVSGGTGCNGSGCGTVFKLDTSGTETVLYRFAGGTTDGCYPYGGVVLDASGNLYGTTSQCGSSKFYGTVFKVDASGTETVLHNFTGGSDGGSPMYTSLLRDKKGNLYGVNFGGGSNGGVLYKLSKSGTFTVLHAFGPGGKDGFFPYGTPAIDKKGNLYGTTFGADIHNNGVVWKVSQKGKETVLHRFRGTDGTHPYAGVVLDAKGNLYGTTQGGSGGMRNGTVYRLNKTGALTVLHSFSPSTDGALSFGDLIQDAADNLYGTNSEGGGNGCRGGGCGTVWKVTP